MRWLALLALLVASSCYAQEEADVMDGKWHVYILPRVVQTGRGAMVNGFHNPSVYVNPTTKAHPFGQPNNHFPWLHPGGVQGDRRRQLVTVYSICWPANGAGPKIFKSEEKPNPEGLTSHDLYTWTFPTGTKFKVELYGGSGLFAIHEVVKSSAGDTVNDWDENHVSLGEYPSWYQPPQDCQSCHSKAGKHASILEPKTKDYYWWLRGSKDGRFSWHPFVYDDLKDVEQPTKIRPALLKYVVEK